MPKGLYRLTKNTPKRGDLASFCLESTNVFSQLALERDYVGGGACPSGLKPFLKLVVGLPGDFLEISESQELWINNSLLKDSSRPLKDSQGRPLPKSLLNPGVIPNGFCLVMSKDNPMGLDSRHFGLIPLESITIVESIYTFESL
jgi:conjugative transfer signal peptidase TraF